MTCRPLPALATWLLNHLTHDNDSLAGDLIEQFRAGRTRVWYWRQVLSAIVVGSWQDIRDHKLLAIRALGLGWVTAFVVTGALTLLGPMILPYWLGQPVILTFPIYLLLTCSTGCSMGWVVARFHRPYGFAFALLLAALTLAVRLPHLAKLIGNALEHERFIPYLNRSLLHAAIGMLSLLAGGFIVGAGSPEQKRIRSPSPGA